MEFLVLTLYAHRENISLECQAFLVPCNSFLMIPTRLLFEDLASAFP